METGSKESKVESIDAKREANAGLKLVTLNFDGKKFQLLQTSFEQLPIYVRILASAVKVIDKSHTTEYFLENHDYSSFASIIYYLRNNELHLPKDVCMNIFKREILYWGINDDFLKTCCFVPYAKYFHEQHAAKTFRKELYRSDIDKAARRMGSWKGFIWKTMNKPFLSSIWAGVYQFLTIAATLFLVANMVYKIDRDLKKELEVNHWSEYYENDIDELYALCKNRPECMTELLYSVCHENIVILREYESTFNLPTRSKLNCTEDIVLEERAWMLPSWDWADFLCLSYFLMIYVVTLIIAPNKREFLSNFYGIMWLLTVVTSSVAILLRSVIPRNKYRMGYIELISYMARMVLLFGLAKNSIYFRVLIYSLSKCLTDIIVLIMFFLMSCAVLAPFIHAIEHKDDVHVHVKQTDDINNAIKQNEAHKFQHIEDRSKLITTFDSYWATIGIMTTNTFEYSPSSWQAHFLAGLLTIVGIFFVSVSIPIFQEEFGFYLSIFKNEEFLKKSRHKDIKMIRKMIKDHSHHLRGDIFRKMWHNVVGGSQRHSEKTRSDFASSPSSNLADADRVRMRSRVNQIHSGIPILDGIKTQSYIDSIQNSSRKVSLKSINVPNAKSEENTEKSTVTDSLKSASSRRL